MSIRPMDMQIVVHKTQEIHPAKQSVVNKQDNELLQMQQQSKNEAATDQKRVLNTEKSEFNKVRQEESSKKKKSRDQKRQSKDEEKESQDEKKTQSYTIGSHFDMKV